MVAAAEPVLALVDGARIKQVFWNLLLNSVEAVGPAGTVSVDLRRIEAGDKTVYGEDVRFSSHIGSCSGGALFHTE